MTNPRHNPYPGPRPFKRGETLYGRQRETAELLDLLIAERIVLLSSPSGAGKTSLVQAALVPELEREGFRVLPVMRPGLHPEDVAQLGKLRYNRYVLSLLLGLEQGHPEAEQTPLAELAGLPLAGYLEHLPAATGDDWHGDVLIFDQFEEVLTVDPTDQKDKLVFFEQVGQALRDRNRWALFSMREEYVAALDPYLRPIPARFDKGRRYRLDLLGPDAAREAMQRPPADQDPAVAFTDAAATELADDLRRAQVQQPDGTMVATLGPFIEPVQLQVVCRRLWDGLAPDDLTIDVDDLAAVGEVDTALRGYYADTVKAIAEKTGARERAIREWVGGQLITEGGIRGQALMGAETSQALANTAIWTLVDAHLVRADQRRGVTWFELAHDRLIAPVRADNAAWFEANLSTLQRQAALWEEQRRPDGLLVSGEALSEAELWAEGHQAELEPHELDFLAACRQARKRSERERQQSQRIRMLALAATAVALLAIIAAIFGVRGQQQATKAETTAEAERAVAEARRVLAESAQARAENERDRAERQSQIARSRQAAAIASDALRRGEGSSALLLAAASYRITDTVEAENAMHQALVEWRGAGVLEPQADRVSSAEFSPDGRIVATVAQQVVHLWEVDGQRRTLALRGHTKPVTDMAWSPDGRFVATVSRDGTGRLWDRETGAEVWQVPVPQEGISVAFHPDGRSVAFGGDDGKVAVWQIEPLSRTAILAHESWGYAIRLRYSPDGQLLAGAYSDGLARVWRSGRATELKGHKDVVSDVAFSPDGQLLATRGIDDTVRLWRADSGEPVGVAGGARELEPRVWFSPDGQYVAATSRTGVAYLWNTKKLTEPPFVLAGHSGAVTAVAFSPDGRTLATTSFDKTARLWDVETKTSQTVLVGHTDLVWWAAFSPDGRRLVTAGSDRTARLWDPHLDEGGELAIRRYDSPVHLAGLSADGERVVAVQDTMVHVWNLETQEEQSFDMGVSDVRAVAYDPNRSVLAIADGQGETILWDAERHARIAAIPPEKGVIVRNLTFDPTGDHLAAARQDGTVLVWNQEDRTLAATLAAHQNDVNTVAFSPDAALLASGSGDGTVKLWDWRQGVLDRSFDGGAPIRAAAFSPDGTYLAAATDGDEIRVWDLATGGDPTAARLAGAGRVRSLAFSPDGDRLAAGDEQGNVSIWRWREGSPVRLTGHRRWVTEVAYHPDGQRLVTAGQDGTVRVWPASPALTVQLVCDRAGNSQAASVHVPADAQGCEGTPKGSWTVSERLPGPEAPIAAGSMLPKAGLPVIYYFEAVPGTQTTAGQPIKLRWDLVNATEAYLYENDTEIGVVAPDEREFRPEKTTIYRLVAHNVLGQVKQLLTVAVVP